MDRARILSVGQCGYDHGNISHILDTSLKADVSGADSARDALDALRTSSYDLVLVNRIFAHDNASGLDLIREIKADPTLAETPVILVSNFPEAQEEAQKLGAFPGFGKGDLNTPECARRIEDALSARAKSS